MHASMMLVDRQCAAAPNPLEQVVIGTQILASQKYLPFSKPILQNTLSCAEHPLHIALELKEARSPWLFA